MKNFDTRTYSISDFIEWDSNGLLILSPDFQRRSVWSDKAKSFLIDTILQGKPIPKLIITQKLDASRVARIVVDGQQRLRAILDYYRNNFKISRAHNTELSKFYFSNLPNNLDKDFLKYEIGVDVLFDIPYEEMLDIFARINSYTVSLNTQEKFNAKYLGYFKQSVYKYGYKYVKYFLEAGILTKAKVSRMGEAELSADLFVILMDGVQTNKGIENFYRKYEDDNGNLADAAKKFDRTMSFIGALYSPSELSNSNWSRIHLFYTLFASIAHFLFGVNGLNRKLRKKISHQDIGKIRFALDTISSKYDDVASDLENSSQPKDYKKFINYSRRGTTDTISRIFRSDFVCEKIISLIR